MKLALPLLEKALAIDPDYAIAHAYAAWCREQMFTHGGHDADDRSAALRHARAALARERDDSSALAIGGFIVAMLDRDFSTALMLSTSRSRSTATPPLHTASAPWFVLCMTTTTPGSSRRSVRCD